MTTTTWRFDFVLPNLVLPDREPGIDSAPQIGEWPDGITLGSEFIAIVPHRDSRLMDIRGASPEAAKLFDSFRTPGGHVHSPAAVIVRNDAPELVRTDMECLVAFRNAVAFAFILRARAALGKGAPSAEPAWSDTFDLHPTIVSPTNRLVTRSEALLAVFSAEAEHLATHSPHISPCGRRLYPDAYLFRALSEIWERRYLAGDRSVFTTAVFRALEVAFLASSVANKNQGSLSEYGTQLALWISAIEVLAWPTKGRADLPAVLALLEGFDWASDKLGEKRYQARYRQKAIAATAVQYAYSLMYGARNEFLHGNPVSAETLVPKEFSTTLSLPRIASTVFRTALAAYLRPAVPFQEFADFELSHEIINDFAYSRALKFAFGLERDT